MRRAWESNLRVSGRLGAAAPGEDGLGAAHPNTHQETEGGAPGVWCPRCGQDWVGKRWSTLASMWDEYAFGCCSN